MAVEVVRPSGDSITLVSRLSVRSLKQQLAERLGIPERRQHLVMEGERAPLDREEEVPFPEACGFIMAASEAAGLGRRLPRLTLVVST